MSLCKYASIDIKSEKKSCTLTEYFFPFDVKFLFLAEDTRMVGTSHKGTIMSDGQFDRAKSK